MATARYLHGRGFHSSLDRSNFLLSWVSLTMYLFHCLIECFKWLNPDVDIYFLGAPNSIGAAWFLVQHKAQMGQNQYIYRITVFTETGSEYYPHMLMWVKQAPPPPPLPTASIIRGRSKRTSPTKVSVLPPECGNIEKVETAGPPTQHQLDMARMHTIRG